MTPNKYWERQTLREVMAELLIPEYKALYDFWIEVQPDRGIQLITYRGELQGTPSRTTHGLAHILGLSEPFINSCVAEMNVQINEALLDPVLLNKAMLLVSDRMEEKVERRIHATQ